MTKPRFRMLADGRIGFPGVLEYVLLAGPRAGTALLAPPTFAEDTDFGYRSGKPTYPFKTRVLDQAAFEQLQHHGWIYDTRHTGQKGEMVDNRQAPGA